MPFHKLTLSFNAGELSPLLSSRLDIAKYESGCQLLENFIILPYGGVIRRPGTQYLGRAKYADKKVRLIGFNFSTTTNFVLELGNYYIRFWTNGIQVAKPTDGVSAWVTAHAYPFGEYVMQGGLMYVCETAHTSGVFADDLAAGKWLQSDALQTWSPWPDTELRFLQYTQINDLMYLVHPDYPAHKITRVADDNWTLAELAYVWPPLLDENVDNITITPSATSGDISLTASYSIFTAADVGTTWQIGHNQAGYTETYTEVALGATSANSAAIRTRGAWSFTTYGTWQGEIRIHRTIYRTGTSSYIRTWRSNSPGQLNISSSGSEDEDCSLYIAFFTHGVAGSSTPTARLEFSNARVYGLVKITSVASETLAYGTVTWGLAQTAATTYWSKAAFSSYQGYPRTVCLHEQRLIYGGTRRRPGSFWGSQIDDFDNFQRGALADHGFMFTIASNESNPINWMVSQSKLLLGTAGAEWTAGAKNEDQAMGAGNVSVAMQSSFGGAYLQPRQINEVVLFCQRQRKKIREMVYSFEKDGYVAPDLNILANHISGSGFAETAFCQQPDAVLWAVTRDGRLIGMTYERDQNVVGWHRHSTQGTFESVATIYGGDEADEVWFSVQRTVGGSPVRYIERFDPEFRTTFDKENKPRYWYLDCGLRSTGGTKVDTISGISHLEGLSVGVLGDGANQPQRIVSGGSVTIQDPALTILVGLPYQSIVQPMNLNLPMQDTVQGRHIRIHEAVVRIQKSLTAKFSSDNGETWDEIFFRDRADRMDASPPIFTGDKKVSTGANFSTGQAISIMQDRPFPCCILAMIMWTDFHGQ